MSAQGKKSDFDVIVIGAGLTGLYQVYSLRNAGFNVRGYEAGSDVGGTWYWNRYPGCRLDTESYTYGYFSLNGILPDWNWSERFAGQPEMLSYYQAAAAKMQVRRHIQFNSRVEKAWFHEDRNQWDVTLDDGTTVTATHVLTAVGFLSATRMPDIPGIESFKGESFHTSRWPKDPAGGTGGKRIDFTGKRVGVIGTGATGVQIIPMVAKTAAQLLVFQRSPNWCTPLANEPIANEEMLDLKSRYPQLLAKILETDTGFLHHPKPINAVDEASDVRNEVWETLYNEPGFGAWLANYQDIGTNRESNRLMSEFVANKVRKRVIDPVTAEKLIPHDHPFGTRRVPLETNYYETYNRPNVRLLDVREAPIRQIEANGIRTAAGCYELDVIIYATGFDAITGALDRIDIRGKGGVPLKQAWADGPVSFLGVQTVGFPNLFTLVSAHNGATFCNVGVCSALQVEWITRLLSYLRDHGLSFAEPTQAAQDAWIERVFADFEGTLLLEADAWWMKIVVGPDGTKKRTPLSYIGGGPAYRKTCEEVAAKGYEGMVLR